MGFFTNAKKRVTSALKKAHSMVFDAADIEPIKYSDPKYKRTTTASRRAEAKAREKYLHVSLDCVQALRRDLGLKYNPGVPYVK